MSGAAPPRAVTRGAARSDVVVETTMFRALFVLRVVLLANALALNVFRWDNIDHHVPAVVLLVLMVAWTGFTGWAYDAPSRRTPPLLVTDLALATGAILASPLIKGEEMRATLPGFWVAAAMLAWAVHWHWRGGLAASLLVTTCDIAVRDSLSQCNYGNLFLLMIGGPILGFCVGLLSQMATARDAAEREAAAARERDRLSRAVHDGVLQVLGIVQRRGAEIGGETAELARLAGEQESALRTLVQREAAPVASGSADLGAAVGALGTAYVSVAAPADPVWLPAADVEEVAAVVAACLSNVRHHVGREAPAWVLVEDLVEAVVVTVRDEGPGIPAGRLDSAEEEGRLGVAQSIRGRMADLGGEARLTTAVGQGVEWELTLPRRPAPTG